MECWATPEGYYDQMQACPHTTTFVKNRMRMVFVLLSVMDRTEIGSERTVLLRAYIMTRSLIEWTKYLLSGRVA